ncbi:HNH endonuclease signature motif containing protein [Micromonospora sp. NPDC047762]|uniref:HNH endonuclease n=1 Tax=unclassified Micromonospora TaxID=2617518 RepID=UPI0033CFE31A
MRLCEIEGCDGRFLARGWCRKHYMQWKRTGDPLGTARKPKPTCGEGGCEREHYAKQLCHGHYQLARKWGKNWRELARPTPQPRAETCFIDECPNPVLAVGYCGSHYQRLRKYGDPLGFRHRPWTPRLNGAACPWCGGAVNRSAGKHKVFCSSGCADASWTAGPNGIRHNMRRRSALAREKANLITERDLARLLARQGGLCAYCRLAAPTSIDHIVPLKLGGRHSIGNLAWACGSCNSSKSDRLLFAWRVTQRTALALAG